MAKSMTLEEIKELNTPMPRTIHYTGVATNSEFEVGNLVNFGVSSETIGSKKIVMGRTVIPTQTISERHIHTNCDASIFIVSGTLVAYLGQEAKEVICPPGTFMYIPEGAIHGGANPSETEEIVLIFAYGGVSNKEAAGIINVIEDPNVYPPKNWNVAKLVEKR